MSTTKSNNSASKDRTGRSSRDQQRESTPVEYGEEERQVARNHHRDRHRDQQQQRQDSQKKQRKNKHDDARQNRQSFTGRREAQDDEEDEEDEEVMEVKEVTRSEAKSGVRRRKLRGWHRKLEISDDEDDKTYGVDDDDESDSVRRRKRKRSPNDDYSSDEEEDEDDEDDDLENMEGIVDENELFAEQDRLAAKSYHRTSPSSVALALAPVITGEQQEKRKRGRPKGSKNRSTLEAIMASTSHLKPIITTNGSGEKKSSSSSGSNKNGRTMTPSFMKRVNVTQQLLKQHSPNLIPKKKSKYALPSEEESYSSSEMSE